ncbi:NlpC/P60 family protein [Sinomicrobium oceani]|uniref:NlpC/P60 family protein n=1 Tax=Sinomicrobium oceani TaxID=1150368 RepID=A0A1K1RLM3_9FLAO|nr:NlpC/P60 family protein [Sinomicrobium oceani]SFW72699.1 NlpC/P60 family protein [Sinomicrobium oceani]
MKVIINKENMAGMRILGCVGLFVLVMSCKSKQGILPITDEQVQIEFGELGDMESESEVPEEEESVMKIEAITDEDVEAELGGPRQYKAPRKADRAPAYRTTAVAADEPINAALLLETGQVVLSDSESSIMLDEVEVVGILRTEQFAIPPVLSAPIAYLRKQRPASAPLMREIKIRSYSPLTITDKVFFAKEMKVKAIDIKDQRLYSYIKDRLGDPYKKDRLDHLTLMQNLYQEVYDISFPRTTSKAILTNYTEGQIHYTKDMGEGDLLFFRFRDRGKPYTHVGIYLKNKRFLTVTPAGGVEIASLRDRMWRNGYIGRGRVKNLKH